MSLFAGLRKNRMTTLVVTAAFALGLSLSACGGDSIIKSDDPAIGTSTTPPEEFAESIRSLVDKASDADKLEVSAAKAYCDVERAYGQRSIKLSKVVQATGEHFAQKYLTLMNAEDKIAPEGQWGLLHALNMAAMYPHVGSFSGPFEDDLRAWLHSSFCEVAEKQVPSSIESSVLFE